MSFELRDDLDSFRVYSKPETLKPDTKFYELCQVLT